MGYRKGLLFLIFLFFGIVSFSEVLRSRKYYKHKRTSNRKDRREAREVSWCGSGGGSVG